MSFKLYFHPLASFCHKAIIAFYENGIPFEPVVVDLADETSTAAFRAVWPMAKMPVLSDDARGRTVAESTIIIEYLDAYYPGTTRFLPAHPDDAWQTRMWDRFYDHYVQEPMRARGEARPARDLLLDRWRNHRACVFDEARGGRFASPQVFESGSGGPVSTVDDYLAFCRMLLNKGKHGSERILSRPSVELNDNRPHHARTEGGVAVLSGLLGQSRLGLRPVHHHETRRPCGHSGPVRLGRRLWHVSLFRL
jgi:Glutathione S-transferase, N-terminal domain/Beta-lactamase